MTLCVHDHEQSLNQICAIHLPKANSQGGLMSLLPGVMIACNQ